MAYMTKGYLMTSDDPIMEENARLYTLPTFELGKKNIHPPVFYYVKEKERWVYRKFDGTDIYLTADEVMRLVGCYMCGKIKMNNWRRYCSSECPYYFNTPALKEIIK